MAFLGVGGEANAPGILGVIQNKGGPKMRELLENLALAILVIILYVALVFL